MSPIRQRARELLSPTWIPAALTQGDGLVLKVGLAVLGANRAADYVSHVHGEHLGAIEESAPMAFWVVLCWLPAILILTGISGRMHRVIWSGHAVGVIVYTALSAGAIMNSLKGWPPNASVYAVPLSAWWGMCALLAFTPGAVVLIQRRLQLNSCPKARWVAALAFALGGYCALVVTLPFEQLRGIGPTFIIAWLHALFMIRTGWRRLEPEEIAAEPVEVTLSDTGAAAHG